MTVLRDGYGPVFRNVDPGETVHRDVFIGSRGKPRHMQTVHKENTHTVHTARCDILSSQQLVHIWNNSLEFSGSRSI